MVDTVRSEAELLALGQEGVPDSFSFQDLRDLIVSMGAGVDGGGIGGAVFPAEAVAKEIVDGAIDISEVTSSIAYVTVNGEGGIDPDELTTITTSRTTAQLLFLFTAETVSQMFVIDKRTAGGAANLLVDGAGEAGYNLAGGYGPLILIWYPEDGVWNTALPAPAQLRIFDYSAFVEIQPSGRVVLQARPGQSIAMAIGDFNISHLAGADAPDSGGGIAAGVGALYSRNVGQTNTVGELWFKTGAGDTDWTKVV